MRKKNTVILDEKLDKIGEGMFGSRLFIGNFSRSIKNIHRGCAKNKSSGLLQMIFFSCLLEVINNCHHIFFWGGKKPSGKSRANFVVISAGCVSCIEHFCQLVSERFPFLYTFLLMKMSVV